MTDQDVLEFTPMMWLYPLAAFLICLSTTPLVRLVAHKKGWLANPSKDRWHVTPTALFGGIAIYLGVALPLMFMADFKSLLPHVVRNGQTPQLPAVSAVMWIGITYFFILGLVDDFLKIKPQTKLIGQLLLASLITFLGFRLQWVTSLTVDTLLTTFWVVGITNAFNLIDNMDGLCAGVGMICAVFLAWLLAPLSPMASLSAMILAGSLAGFLIFNFNPASIFMGDSGSLLIGFSIAVLGLSYSEVQTANTLHQLAVPVLICMVPILDTTMVTMIRLLSGRKASTGGKDHTSHRLVLTGFSERSAVLFLYGIGILSGFSARFVSQGDVLTTPVVLIPIGLSILLMGIYLAQLRVYPEKEFSLLRDRAYTPILMELTYKRQLMLVTLDFGLIAFAYYLSYRLRYDTDEFNLFFRVFLRSLPAVVACKMIAFFSLKIYRGFWGFMSTDDVYVYLKASFLGTILSVVAVTFIYRFENFSKALFVIDFLLTTGLVLGTRGSFRLFEDSMKRRTVAGKQIFIYGAGRGGEILLREILNNKQHRLKPVGFLDDEPLKWGKKLQGYPILGSLDDFENLQKKHGIDGILISFRGEHPVRIDQARQFCRTQGLFLKQFTIYMEDLETEQ